MRLLILSRNGELYSTRSLFLAARRRSHFVRVVDHLHCDIMVSNDHLDICYEGQSLSGYDALIPRIGHTATKMGASVILQFENMGFATTLDSRALLKARDKLTCLQILSSQGVPIPKTLIMNNIRQLQNFHHRIDDFPKILKLQSGTHGLGVLKADDAKSLETLVETFASMRHKTLIQEFVKESSGIDIRAFVVDGEVVASMMRTAQEGEFRSNLHRGGLGQPVILSERERHVAVASAEILGLKVAGVDMLRAESGPKVIEVNASPGLEGIETYTKVDVAKSIIKFVERQVKSADYAGYVDHR